ncbi:MAG: copper resistance protein CopC [Acidimicrobiia bacterium]|nr:copper resistance protein CopC [Acidimicrobiia bacterium]NNL28988.1 copper resistance protein CopC [Acidimicrobiia bacterium]
MPNSPDAVTFIAVTSRWPRRLGGLFLVLALCLLGAGPAGAHSGLISASPEPGAEIGGRINQIELVFDAAVTDAVVTLTAPGEVEVDGTLTSAAPERLIFEMNPLQVDGLYLVRYKFASEDGDLNESAYTFSYRAAAGEPGSMYVPESAATGSGIIWTILVALLAVVAILWGVLFRTFGRNSGN